VQKLKQEKKQNRTSINCTSEDLVRIKNQADYHGRSEIGHLRKMMDREDLVILKEQKEKGK